MEERYLPIGSVVLLEGATKMIMINGYCAVAQDKKEKFFDYRGCPYPEGVISSGGVALFDHEEIKEVVYRGFFNDESKDFIDKLNKIVK